MKKIYILCPLLFTLFCSNADHSNDQKKEALELNKKAISVASYNPKEALELFRKAASLDPKNVDYINNQGAILLTLKEYEKAIPLFKSAIQLDEKYARGHYNLGVCYSEMGDYNSSVKNYKKAILYSPGGENLEARFNLGAAYAKLKKKKEAIQEFKLFLSKAQPSNNQAIEEAKKRIKELEKK
ncbi:tetratricopeptide repeat protein [Leptospira paudalimensis]|uniref:Tetratricopeptide repeat protein n=1 Tax=Leptospira paudalimensis TaxID=2950024 RepID=A0ABT3MCN3_9LEPT|nr:tetratricopeptide repeat protein [Leptospira paudalimensis]MCW7506137.1 tetratricopeptide repeat protein [Leptospira paudalimensis]